MQRSRLFILIAIVLFAAPAVRAQAQFDEHKFEIGGHYTAIGLEDFRRPINGVGARFGYNFNEYVALDAEASFFPETRLGNEQFGQKAQGFAGLHAGARSKYVGLFAKARPGVMSVGEITSSFDCEARTGFNVCRPNHNQLAFDAGLVFEVYPAGRAIIRVDVGDTIVRL